MNVNTSLKTQIQLLQNKISALEEATPREVVLKFKIRNLE